MESLLQQGILLEYRQVDHKAQSCNILLVHDQFHELLLHDNNHNHNNAMDRS